MPHSKKRTPKPYCKRCGAFLVGGKDGYCPNRHDFTLQEVYDKCYESLHTFPIGHIERTKILEQIKRLEDKYDKEIKFKQLQTFG